MASIMTQPSFMAKKEEVKRNWYVVDAEGKTVGRLSTQIAKILQGKNKPTYTPHIDTGDFVIVINADKIVFTGNKTEDKLYYRHTGYPGGLKTTTPKKLMEKHPERILQHAVKGMMPKSILGKHMIKKMKVYAGATHPHEAQKPVKIDL